MQELAHQNIAAWDSLYGSTGELIWGKEPASFIERYLPKLAENLDDSSLILDAATGEGRNLPALRHLKGRLMACDASENALAKIPASIRENISLFFCDLCRTPFSDDFFDVVLLSDTLETLPDPGLALAEVARILKPGGRLLINIPGEEDEIAGIDMSPLEPGHLYRGRFFYRFLGEEEAIALLESAGLLILESELSTWLEESHPHYRTGDHRHTSRIFLAQKSSKT